MMATLYDVGLPTINEHIKKIYADSELEEAATIRNFRIVQTEGSRQVTRDTKHYSLQMIIAVGFKVNSERAVQFRKWVNQIPKCLTSNPLSQIVTSNPRLQPDTHFAVDMFPYKTTELFQKSDFRSKPSKKPGNTPLSGT